MPLIVKEQGFCSPYEMAIALAENATTNGVKLFLNSRVLSIKKENSIFNIKLTMEIFLLDL